MKEVIRLLELKNEYLEKYLSTTKAYVMNLEQGSIGNIELLRDNRENILGIIEHIDERVNESANNISNNSISTSNEIKNAVRHVLFLKENLISDIVDLDAKLFSLINDEKNSIVNELGELREVKEAVVGYDNSSLEPKGNYINIEK